jgi:hypothetical protein
MTGRIKDLFIRRPFCKLFSKTLREKQHLIILINSFAPCLINNAKKRNKNRNMTKMKLELLFAVIGFVVMLSAMALSFTTNREFFVFKVGKESLSVLTQ